MRICSESDCNRKHHAKGLCYSHYMRGYKGLKAEGPLGVARQAGVKPCGNKRCLAAHRMNKHVHYLLNKSDYIERAVARDPADTRKYKQKWKSQNLGKVRAHTMARKRGLKNATPKWLSDEQWDQINALYAEAQERGMHVDHIVPLKGGTVCGLHVPWNLRILDPQENMRRPRVWQVE